jgi:hypothetical protein
MRPLCCLTETLMKQQLAAKDQELRGKQREIELLYFSGIVENDGFPRTGTLFLGFRCGKVSSSRPAPPARQ